jgi:hypothetical protein
MAMNRSQPTSQVIPAARARQGEIILRTPLRRAVFVAGLVGAVILAILIAVWTYG